MTIKVRIPQPLRPLTGNQATVDGSGGTILQCIQGLESEFPGIRERLLDDGGELRRFVNVFVNGEDVRFMSGLDTSVKDGDEVSIVPQMAGG